MIFRILLILGMVNSSVAQNFLCVSLGNSCTIAHQLAINKLTNAYYPFDWNLTLTPESIIYALEHRFEGFLDSQNLANINSAKIHDTLYDILLVHDFPVEQKMAENGFMYAAIVKNWQDFIIEVQQKYVRRVERFLNLNNYPGKLIFIRYDCHQEQAAKLKIALDECFAQKIVNLVIINSFVESPYNHVDNIDYYYMARNDMSFPGNNAAFNKLFGKIITKLVR